MPTLPSLQRLTLREVRLTFNTNTSAVATSIDIEYDIKFDEASAGQATVDQHVAARRNAKVKVKGWNSTTLSFGDILPGTKITALTILSTDTGTPSILQSDFFTYFPVNSSGTTWMIGPTKGAVTDKPSTWETELVPNVLQ